MNQKLSYRISVIIRTYNESKYLRKLLTAISKQNHNFKIEIIIVDSGSTDKTIEIANSFKCKIFYIKKKNFTFGRSLNIGCSKSKGDYFVFVSGHCIPANKNWLKNLLSPLIRNKSGYSYSRQIGNTNSKFSEKVLFEKYFPNNKNNNQIDYFCNNASSSIKKSVWQKYKFNEKLTGLEDLELAKRYNSDGGVINYCHKSVIYHIHEESWGQIKKRYEREAYALRYIEKKITINLIDTIYYFFISIFKDIRLSFKANFSLSLLMEIIQFRSAQYLGSYLGCVNKKSINKPKKTSYFYP